jgi:mannobiose 2-epimerase
MLINSNSVLRKTVGACTDRYRENWEPLHGPGDDRVSYGHDLENVWLLIHACEVVGIAPSVFLDFSRTVFDYCLRYGFDHENGGFYDSGPVNSRADRREKTWWVQAEALVAALEVYLLSGEPMYWDCFSRTLDWIVNHQADWKHGEWHERIRPDGKPSGVKAGPWKGPYHSGRAMLRCLQLLESI